MTKTTREERNTLRMACRGEQSASEQKRQTSLSPEPIIVAVGLGDLKATPLHRGAIPPAVRPFKHHFQHRVFRAPRCNQSPVLTNVTRRQPWQTLRQSKIMRVVGIIPRARVPTIGTSPTTSSDDRWIFTGVTLVKEPMSWMNTKEVRRDIGSNTPTKRR